ncbi:DUF3515 domain-containing protein [Mycolicibacterium bacteremicum]|uniref:DUF3515 domain-containing protein n=1 Tax=Mycolicibacterium bacteremicum TaxID=564198 RepID=UPI000D6B29D4|nr:DUF3515 domain-containing protein [Mycolicibacterium bacteremicum]MCV7434582.1 DUF3515 domain-containing protein [Mycolicibacterium bacteremicum]
MTDPDDHPADRDGPPRSLIIAAVGVAVAAVIVLLTFAATRQAAPEEKPVAIAAAPAPQAESPECTALMSALPEQLGDYRRATAVEPVPAGAAAWQADPSADAVIMRCGLERPVDFRVGTPVQVVDEVQWFEVSQHGVSTWFAVDRSSYVALTLPTGSGPTPIQLISKAIARTMPARQPDPGPAR